MTREERLEAALRALIVEAVKSVEYGDWPELQEAVDTGRSALELDPVRKLDAAIANVRAANQAREKAQEDRKVIGLWDRAPYTPETLQEAAKADPVNRIVAQPVDDDAVETLETALEQARKGGVTGAIVLMGLCALEDSDVVTDVSMLNSLNTADNIQIFLGGLETAKAEILQQFNDQWLEDDDED